MGIAVNSVLHACKLTVRNGARHGPLHRRWQIGLVLLRYKKRWPSRYAQNLVTKYGAIDA